ncbi:MAG: O-antigen ligase family protein [Clostridia bacterium]|nr:O-antigen ligase family protein [Clostridia bacterium]
MINFKEKARTFFDSYLYPICIAIVVFTCHTFSLEHLGVLLLFCSMLVGLILCTDIRVAIAPLFLITFTVSYKSFLAGNIGSVSFLVVAILALIMLFVGVTFNIIHNKKAHFIKSAYKSKLFWGIVVLCGGFLLNGFFNFRDYKAINLTFALLLIFFFAIAFFVFYIGLDEREGNVEYLIFVLYVTSILLIAEMIVLYIRDAIFINGEIIKESLILGWGVWNNVGGLLTMLIPIHFYYASTKKRGYVFYGTAILTYVTILFTLSRSSLLFATIIFAICVIITCIKGVNTKINRIITVGLAVVAIIGIIALWDKLSTTLSSYLNQGFNDNGRFELYKHGVDNFLSHPIFGGGFGSCLEDNFGHGIEPNRYHNTIIEMLAACGIIGFGAYVFHRYQTVKLFIQAKKDESTIFLALTILALLLTSLLDNHFFNLYTTMYYSVILCVIEKYQSTNK